MSSDDPFSQIEDRLRHEADGLLDSFGELPSPSSLMGKHRRRVTRRAALLGTCAAAVLLVTVIVVSRKQPWSPGPATPGMNEATVAGSGALDAQANPMETMPGSQAEPAYPLAPVNVLPILLVEWDSAGEPVVTAGFYMCEPAETLSLQDLTPGERYAVQQVLGTALPDILIQTL